MDRAFKQLLGVAAVAALERDAGSAYGVWADGSLGYTNTAWSAFAHANDGDAVLATWPLGRNVWEAVPEVFVPVYRGLWASARETSRPAVHTYECSSPTTRRVFQMIVHPLDGGAVVVRNYLELEVSHPGAPSPDDAKTYQGADGFLRMCANCRRVQRADLGGWDWVPGFVSRPPRDVTHAVCDACLELYYAE